MDFVGVMLWLVDWFTFYAYCFVRNDYSVETEIQRESNNNHEKKTYIVCINTQRNAIRAHSLTM